MRKISRLIVVVLTFPTPQKKTKNRQMLLYVKPQDVPTHPTLKLHLCLWVYLVGVGKADGWADFSVEKAAIKPYLNSAITSLSLPLKAKIVLITECTSIAVHFNSSLVRA